MNHTTDPTTFSFAQSRRRSVNALVNRAPFLFALLVWLWLAAMTAFAHDPGLSAVELQAGEKQFRAHLTFAHADIQSLITFDQDRNGTITADELMMARAQLESLLADTIELRADNQRLLHHSFSAQFDESNAIHIEMTFPAVSRTLEWHSPVINRLPQGHRQFLTLRDEENNTLETKLLDARANLFQFDLNSLTASHSSPQSFRQFLLLGVEHILFGWDHLAFLLALLIAGSRLREAAKIITSFTVAHSITLSLATLDLVQLPPAIVEPLIAASIIYVALENLLCRNISHRWRLTFAFGLIHGFGFATVLRELGLGANGQGIAMPLLSFNLGVEIGQLLIVAAALPLIWRLQARPALVRRLVPASSLLLIVVGSWWLIERTLL